MDLSDMHIICFVQSIPIINENSWNPPARGIILQMLDFPEFETDKLEGYDSQQLKQTLITAEFNWYPPC
jgi:hypothetical protein